jgi:hypothetical protein
MSNKKANIELRFQTRMLAINALINLSVDETSIDGTKISCTDYFKINKINTSNSFSVLWKYEGNSIAKIYKPEENQNLIMPIYIYEN